MALLRAGNEFRALGTVGKHCYFATPLSTLDSELRLFTMLDKHSTTGLHPQPQGLYVVLEPAGSD